MPSALPSDSFTPCGTTGQISASAHASRRALALREARLGDDLDEVDRGWRGDEIGGELGTKAEPDASLPQWTSHGRSVLPAT